MAAQSVRAIRAVHANLFDYSARFRAVNQISRRRGKASSGERDRPERKICQGCERGHKGIAEIPMAALRSYAERKKEDRSGDIILRNYESRAVARKKHES